jgi:LysR family glycine cleavage system transcriptional activator
MLRRLPPLNALRAFHASARLQSFTRAADELGVTQTAVSRQIRSLEGYLGVPLFVRQHNGLQLTEIGAEYHRYVSAGFLHLLEGTDRMRGRTSKTVVRVSVLPNFAIRWLIPRLSGFQECNPKVVVNLVTLRQDIDFATGDFDVAIRYGHGSPRHCTDLLFGADLFPVCSPQVAEQLRSVESLRDVPMLQVSGAPEDWPAWLSAAGAPDVELDSGPWFDSFAFALQAAIEGLGVAMARGAFVADDLRAGRRLVPDLSRSGGRQPFRPGVPPLDHRRCQRHHGHHGGRFLRRSDQGNFFLVRTGKSLLAVLDDGMLLCGERQLHGASKAGHGPQHGKPKGLLGGPRRAGR